MKKKSYFNYFLLEILLCVFFIAASLAAAESHMPITARFFAFVAVVMVFVIIFSAFFFEAEEKGDVQSNKKNSLS